MDGLTWLIVSWLVVGALCYLMLSKLGAPQTEVDASVHPTTTSNTSASSGWNADKRPAGDWLNELIAWLFNNMNRAPETLQAWMTAMNDAAKKISSPGKCEVLFEDFGGIQDMTKVPRISNIRLQHAPNNHLILRSNISVPELNLKLVSSQRMDDRLLVTNYDAKIIDLHGEIEARMACIANQIYLMACFGGRPELDIQLVNRDSTSAGAVSSTLVEEAIRKCLLSAVTNISLTESSGQHSTTSTGTASATAYSSLSRGMAVGGTGTNVSNDSPVVAPVQEMMKRISQSTQLANQVAKLQGMPNKVRVKVIRAQRLGGDRTVHQPYVVLEMDEPAQKFQTSRGLNMSPYWEESFTFELTAASEEILFEIYEGESDGVSQHEPEDVRFLGLAIVGLEEIRRSGTEVAHTLKLQGRPYRNDSITGNLTVQFDFYHDPTLVAMGKQVDQTVIRNSTDQFRETMSSTRRPIYDPRDSFGAHDAHDVVPTKTTTVTVKTVSQQSASDRPQPPASTAMQSKAPAAGTGVHSQPQLQQEHHLDQKTGQVTRTGVQCEAKVYDPRGQQIGASEVQQQHGSYSASAQQQPNLVKQQQYTTVQQQSLTSNKEQQQLHVPPGSSADSARDKTAQHASTSLRGQQIISSSSHPQQRHEQQEVPAVSSNRPETLNIGTAEESDEMRHSRGREKKKEDEMPTKKRDRSFFSELRDRLSGRRHSKRRAKSFDTATGELEEAVSLPPSRDPSRTRFSERPGGRSRDDSGSYGGKSERSTKSLYQNSTLLLEVQEKNGQLRYYLIPPSILDEPEAMKLLRLGKKLHVYSDHTFVAVKSPGGTICGVCNRRIGRSSFTKQAYQCRDCHLVCHKPCHYKTESYCTASTVNKLNITKDINWEHFLTTFQIDEFISEDGV